MKKNFKYFFIGILLIISCEKSDDKANLSGGAKVISTNISGITQTDINGNIYGSIDADDWTTMDIWPASVPLLFTCPDTTDKTGCGSGSVSISEFPNPVDDHCNLYINTAQACVFKYVIVDAQNTILECSSFRLIAGGNLRMISMPDGIFSAGALYRMYYSFVESNNHEFARGHGDILMQ